jgi:hypothetical protein
MLRVLKGRFKSRTALLMIGFFGLLIGLLPERLHASGSERTICDLLSGILYFFAFYKLCNSDFVVKERSAHPIHNSGVVILCAIVSAVCILTSYFIALYGWQHSLLQLAGYFLLLFCFSLPHSAWQQLPFAAVMLEALFITSWEALRSFASIPTWIFLAICVAWLFVSLVVFRFINHRKAAYPPVELH